MTTVPVLDATFVAHALGETLLERRGLHTAFARTVIDSRLAGPGDLFVALPGEHHDGHSFAAEAVARGARGLLLERVTPNIATSETAMFIVENALTALQRLAAAWRQALPATDVVGVTGSVGKTTTKLMTAAVLGRRYRVQATELNYNNEIGVPLCLLDLRPDSERAVVELGMYTTGEISLLCEWARPRTGIVLNVGPSHLERAGSMEAIARAKRELVEALPAGGYALLYADDPTVAAMASYTRARVWLFGETADADVRGSDIETRGAAGFSFTLAAGGKKRRVHVSLPGTYLLPNVLAAATAGLADSIPFEEVAATLETLDVPLRLTVRHLPGGVTLLDDTYNASPASTLAALDLLAELPGRRLALLGDMLELGELAEPSHEEVGRRTVEVVDSLFTVGELAAAIARAAAEAGLSVASHHATKEQAAAALIGALRPGDAVLIKGSRALALETVVDEIEMMLAEEAQT